MGKSSSSLDYWMCTPCAEGASLSTPSAKYRPTVARQHLVTLGNHALLIVGTSVRCASCNYLGRLENIQNACVRA